MKGVKKIEQPPSGQGEDPKQIHSYILCGWIPCVGTSLYGKDETEQIKERNKKKNTKNHRLIIHATE